MAFAGLSWGKGTNKFSTDKGNNQKLASVIVEANYP